MVTKRQKKRMWTIRPNRQKRLKYRNNLEKNKRWNKKETVWKEEIKWSKYKKNKNERRLERKIKHKWKKKKKRPKVKASIIEEDKTSTAQDDRRWRRRTIKKRNSLICKK